MHLERLVVLHSKLIMAAIRPSNLWQIRWTPRDAFAGHAEFCYDNTMITDRTLLVKTLAALRDYRETRAQEIRDYGYRPDCYIFAHFHAVTAQPDFVPPLSCEAVTAVLEMFVPFGPGHYAILRWLMASTACQCLAEELGDASSDNGSPPWDDDMLSQQLWLMRLRRLAENRNRPQVRHRDDTVSQANQRELAIAAMWEHLRLMDYLCVAFRTYKLPVALELTEARAKELLVARDAVATAPARALNTPTLTPAPFRGI